MADFDPKAYLAKKNAGGFDPGAYLSSKGAAVPAAQPAPAVPEESRVDKLLGFLGLKGHEWIPENKPLAPDDPRRNQPAPDKLTRDAGPLADDWGAQGIVGGLLGAGAGRVVQAGAKAMQAPAVVGRVAGAATEGAVASKAQGGDALPGAVIGGGIPFLGSAARAGMGKLGAAAVKQEATDLLGGVVRGTEGKGAATPTAAKRVQLQEGNALDALRADKELAQASSKPAAEALPVFHDRMDKVGGALDPHYDLIDAATGGVRVRDLAAKLDAKAAEYAKTPLNEQYIAAVNDIKASALAAWGDAGVVPTRAVRAMVTRLQKRGSQVINTLNPGEASQMKVDMAGLMKDFIDERLDQAAAQHPAIVGEAVGQIRALNKQYAALATMADAVEQRGWKESTGALSLGGHGQKAAEKGGLLAGAGMLMTGNVPGAVAAVAAPHALPLASAARRGVTSRLAEAHRNAATRPAIEGGSPGAALIERAREEQRRIEAQRHATIQGSR